MDWARRRFLRTMSAGVPAAILGLGADRISGYERRGVPLREEGGTEAAQFIDLGSTLAGDETIPFRKHTLDLGPAESVTVADVNCDGRLDIICGENWYEQTLPERGHEWPSAILCCSGFRCGGVARVDLTGEGKVKMTMAQR